jgi:hypothetical protein
MRIRHCLALTVACAVALGCASARAQEEPRGPDHPPPVDRPPPGRVGGPPPMGPGPTDGRQMKRHMGVALEELERAIAALEADPNRSPEGTRRLEEMKRHAEVVRDRMARDDRDAALRGERDPRHGEGRAVDRRPGGAGSIEQRVEMLERAVREMHEMFERRHVGAELRQQAEHELRARMQAGPPPGERPAPRPGDEAAGPPPQRPDQPRPPMPPRQPRPEPQAEQRELRADMQKVMEDAHAQMEQARRQFEEAMAAMRRQLDDTQSALKKAEAEIESLKAKSPK